MSKIQINYRKWKKPTQENLDMLNEQYQESYGEIENYFPFRIQQIQNYNPCFDLFFDMNESNYDSITMNHKYCFKDMKTVVNMENMKNENIDVFVKFAPLLDPIHYLIGKYSNSVDVLRNLPKYKKQVFHKLQDRNNASYVDNFFYFLSSNLLNNHNCLHGMNYFGSFLGVQDKYKFNASDDIDYLIQSPYFMDNKEKLYEFANDDIFQGGSAGSHKFKPKLEFMDDDIVLDDIENIELDSSDIEVDSSNHKLT